MNDETNELNRQLEEATAGESPGHIPMDDETASLREGWVAMGRLLEAAQPMDEPFELRSVARRTRGRGPTLAVVAALAASLLIGLTTAWLLIRNDRSDDPNGGEMAAGDDRQDRGAEPLPEKPIEEPEEAVAVAVAPQATMADPFAWDDSFDDQLALLGEDVIRMEEDWYHLDDPFESILDALEQMEEDLQNDTL